MWFWSGLPESSTLNSALIRNLPSHAGPSAWATDGSFGGVELAHTTLSIRPCCSMACRSGVDDRAGEVEDDAATVAGLLDELLGQAGRIGERNVLEDALALEALLLGEVDHAAVDEIEARCVDRDDDQLALGAGSHRGLRAAQAGVVRAHVDGREVRALEAGLGHAGDDQVHVLLGVVVLVDAALDEAGAAHDAQHLVLLDQLLGEAGDLLRVGLLLVRDVVDRPAVDAAVVVDAGEVRLRERR